APGARPPPGVFPMSRFCARTLRRVPTRNHPNEGPSQGQRRLARNGCDAHAEEYRSGRKNFGAGSRVRTAFIIISLVLRANDVRRHAMRDEVSRFNAGPFACAVSFFLFL